MLNVNKLSIQFADRVLFNEISFAIHKEDKIGLVGRNGAGKSTLLKNIAGVEGADSGEIHMAKNISIGYLPQEMNHPNDLTVYEEVKKAFEQVNLIHDELDRLNNELATRTDYESDSYHQVIEKVSELNTQLEYQNAFNIDKEIYYVLNGLGFDKKDYHKLIGEFSGGWKMRIALAKLLLEKPSVLLLDEPTNHLDIESIYWLEKFLKQFNGAILLISHDKDFIDGVTNRTIEINNGRVYDYKFAFKKYTEVRELELEQQVKNAMQQQKDVAKTKELIEKFRYKKNKAAFAQSLIKKLDKTEMINVDDVDMSSLNISFPPAPSSGKIVLRAEEINKSFPNKNIFDKADLTIVRGEKIALIGKNGVGKSTLLKMIMNQESVDSGDLELGHNVKIGYFAQNQADELDSKKTILETIEDAASEETRKRARTILGSFMFTGEDVDKKVSVLSGGEKGRLALCKLLLEPINFLIMDEPTNHLDIVSKEVLKESLLKFDGSLIIVSHDRDFLNGLSNKVVEVDDFKIKEVNGTIEEFLKNKNAGSLQDISYNAATKVDVKTDSKPSSNKQQYLDKKQFDREKKKLQNKVSKLEKEITSQENIIKDLDGVLANLDYSNQEEANKVLANYNLEKVKLQKAMDDWEEALFSLEEYN